MDRIAKSISLKSITFHDRTVDLGLKWAQSGAGSIANAGKSGPDRGLDLILEVDRGHNEAKVGPIVGWIYHKVDLDVM